MTKINRYTYYVNEPEDFEKLLNFWADRDVHYPIFVEYPTVNQRLSVIYWLETEWYRASITLHPETLEAVDNLFSKQFIKDHLFIECRVDAGDAASAE